MNEDRYGSKSILEQASVHGMLNLHQHQHHAQDSEEFSESLEAEESDLSGSSAESSGSSNVSGMDEDVDDYQKQQQQLVFETKDAMELAQFGATVVRLPRGLCEYEEIFNEFFSLETWQMLPKHFQVSLQQYLPNFNEILEPEVALAEVDRTVEMLFTGGIECFGHTPLGDLQQRLEEGHYRPDVKKLRENIAKSHRREQRFRQSERLSQLAKQLFLSRERLLRTAYKSGPDVADLRNERTFRRQQPQRLYANASDIKLSTMQRSRRRFYADVHRLKQQVGCENVHLSADEEDDADTPTAEELLLNAQSEQQATENAATSSSATDRSIYSTFFKRRHDLADDEALRIEQHGKQPRLSHRNFRQYLLDHRRRKLTDPSLTEFETSDIRLRDVCSRAQLGGTFKKFYAAGKAPGRKPKAKLNETKAGGDANVSAASPAVASMEMSNVEEPLVNGLLSPQQQQQQQQADVTHDFVQPPEAAASAETRSQPLDEIIISGGNNNSNNTNSNNDVFLRDDEHEPFHIFDGDDVELQQEEVETFGTCEETIPAFVISNEEVIAPSTAAVAAVTTTTATTAAATTTSTSISVDALEQQQQQQQPQQQSQQQQQQKVAKQQGAMPKLQPIPRAQQQPQPAPTAVPAKTPTSKAAAAANANGGNAAATPPAVVTMKKPPVAPVVPAASTSPGVTNALADAGELIQETHACYFSLIRDFFCATTYHRMSYEELRTRIDVWLRNPITALNDWYAQADNWSALLLSAIDFLAGNTADQPDEFVPYIEHKTHLNLYQWIGAGRDSDTRLTSLCHFWLQRRGVSTASTDTVAASPPNVPLPDGNAATGDALTVGATPMVVVARRRISIELDDGSGGVYDGGASPPPPPRCPTTWTVRPASADEVAEFQRQERERFEHPHRAYTYRMYGFESVVGPVKGIYSQTLALTKARGHNMMIGDRPNFVTILTLVRDATARLPNGEGTRADISELLKCSQYINRDAPETVLQTIVSGALDRMHTEHDPCVRYDPKRKIWIYLHRNRSEKEFERMHQQNQGVGKPRKTPQRKNKVRSALKDDGEGPTAAGAQALLGDGENATALSTFTLPALVPSNPIVVSSGGGGGSAKAAHAHLQQQQQQQQQPQPQILAKCPPVPPLKYNIPAQVAQKSLLKSAVLAQRQSTSAGEAIVRISATADGHQQQQQQQHQQQQHSPQQRAVLRAVSSPGGAVTSPVRQYNIPVSQLKAAGASPTAAASSTPIVVATPSGLQTVHVAGHGGATTTTTSPGTASATPRMQMLSATVGGKKVALNKPIIINQITQQQQQQHQQQQQQQQPAQAKSKGGNSDGFMMPLRVAIGGSADAEKAGAGAHVLRNLQTLMIDGNESSLSSPPPSSTATPQTTPPAAAAATAATTTTTPKNIIRFVPAVSPATPQQQQQQQQSMGSGITIAARQTPQAVQIVGQRVIAKTTTVRPQPAKLDGSVHVTAGSGGAVLKMSPQAFAALQQKQQQQQQQQQQTAVVGGQTMIVKAGGIAGLAQTQRVVLGNTAIIAQSGGTPTTFKNIVLQQRSIGSSALSMTTQKLTSTTTTTTPTNATNLGGGVTTLTPPAKAAATTTTTNLTPQQQRVLLQNLKQQQQQQQQTQVQFKTVQVVANSKQQPASVDVQQQQQQQPQRQQGQVQILAQQRTVSVGGATSPAGATAASAGKTLAVVMSPAGHGGGSGRVMKTISRLQPHAAKEPAQSTLLSSGTRVVSTTTGQIISLEGLLQKQGGALRIANASGNIGGTATTSDGGGGGGGGSGGVVVKTVNSTNVIQLQSGSPVSASGGAQYSVVATPPRNVITVGSNSASPHRIISTKAVATGSGGKIIMPPLSGAGGGGANITTKPFNRAATTVTAIGGGGGAVSGGNNNSSGGTPPTASGMRVINATTVGSGGLNIASLQGKQLIFATKSPTAGGGGVGATIKTLAAAGTATTVKPVAKINATTSTLPATSQVQTVIMGNQILRVQQVPAQQQQQQQQSAVVGSPSNAASTTLTKVQAGTRIAMSLHNSNEALGNALTTTTAAATTLSGSGSSGSGMTKTLVLGTSGGQTIRLQPAIKTSMQSTVAGAGGSGVVNITKNLIATTGAATGQLNTMMKTSNANALSNRVVLAVQGGGQIFLSPNFTTGSGNTISLKSLQNMKVVSLAQASTVGGGAITTTTIGGTHTSPVTVAGSSVATTAVTQELSQQQ